jgi:hypothetical protein
MTISGRAAWIALLESQEGRGNFIGAAIAESFGKNAVSENPESGPIPEKAARKIKTYVHKQGETGLKKNASETSKNTVKTRGKS